MSNNSLRNKKVPVYVEYSIFELCQALNGDRINVTERDIQKARENDAGTLYKIGDIYYNDEDYEKAFAWYYKAALQHHTEAQSQVSWMYRLGEGVSQDGELAKDWAKKAASTGEGVSGGYSTSMNQTLKNAAHGNISAMNNIGIAYRNGRGVTKDIPTAIKWYTRAANLGYVAAQINLGWVYKNEVKDLQKAINWYQKAADNKHWLAEEYVIQLNSQGYYAKEKQKEAATIQNDNTINNTSQSSTANNSDDHFNSLFDSRMKAMQEAFELKMGLMEKKYEGKLTALDQERHEQNEEIKELRKKLAGMESAASNRLNYDSSENDNDNNATSKMRVTKVNNGALQKEPAALEQEKLEQHEENKLPKEKLVVNTNSNRNFDLLDNDENDINYDTECSSDEKDDKDNENNATATTLQDRMPVYSAKNYTYPSYDPDADNTDINYDSDTNNYDSDTNFADPNYDSDFNDPDLNYDSSNNED